jgi:hypothetical protein
MADNWMTICIASRCTENDSFIIAGDRLFSYGGQLLYESISLKRLQVSLDRRWHCMFAGDVPHVLPIVRRVRKELSPRRAPHRLDLIDDAFRKAYQDYRVQLVNDRVLSIYGITLDAYRQGGLRFRPKEQARINSQIEDVRVGVDFIVYGYDDLNAAHLFTLSESNSAPFAVKSICRDQDGIAVIGCGSGHAIRALLDRRAPLPIISQVEMLCRVCEAKFDAEQDPEVGRDSAAGVIKRPSSTVQAASEVFITLPALQAIRDAHDKRSDRPYPPELLEALIHCVNSNITTERMSEAVRRAEQDIIAERLRDGLNLGSVALNECVKR